MYEALGVRDVDSILKPEPKPMPMDPAVEHIQALAATPFQAFKGQDHRAHITAHLNFMGTNLAQNNPIITGALSKNIFEHISLMALEQVEIEFMREIQMIQQMSQNPQAMQNPAMQMQVQALTSKVESRKAELIADMMEDYMKEEKKIMGDFGNDPIAKLRARELDLQAQENARKKQTDEERINLDKMKAMMNQMNQQEKLEQNEDLAELRAATSLTKTELTNRAKKEII